MKEKVIESEGLDHQGWLRNVRNGNMVDRLNAIAGTKHILTHNLASLDDAIDVLADVASWLASQLAKRLGTTPCAYSGARLYIVDAIDRTITLDMATRTMTCAEVDCTH